MWSAHLQLGGGTPRSALHVAQSGKRCCAETPGGSAPAPGDAPPPFLEPFSGERRARASTAHRFALASCCTLGSGTPAPCGSDRGIRGTRWVRPGVGALVEELKDR